MRISVTQRCNLRCFYCHKEGNLNPKQIEMSPNEIARIVTIVTKYNIHKVKITGGEPLLRKDIIVIIKKIHAIDEIQEISLTTNGILLEKYAKKLKYAGLDRVNVSLDSINKATYEKITGSDLFDKVLTGIDEAIAADLTPLKLNMVLLKKINEIEIWEMINFIQKKNIILQLIEFESPREDKLFKTYHKSPSFFERQIKEKARKVVTRGMHHRRRYILKHGGEVEIVNPMHNTEFCEYCNRIRISSDGRFQPCLFQSSSIDFLNPLRDGASDKDLEELFLTSIKLRKPFFTS